MNTRLLSLRYRDRSVMGDFKDVSVSPAAEMAPQHRIHENMAVIGADAVHMCTADRLEGNRIKYKSRSFTRPSRPYSLC